MTPSVIGRRETTTDDSSLKEGAAAAAAALTVSLRLTHCVCWGRGRADVLGRGAALSLRLSLHYSLTAAL